MDAVRMAYFALVHCHINYCILVWGNSPAGSYIFRLQRRAVRVLGGIGYRDDCKHLFSQLNILTVPSVYILTSILYVNENRQGYRSHSSYHDYQTRNRDNIRPEYCRLTATQRGPMNMAAVFFNKLPTSARSLTDSVLKRRLKKFLISRAFYSVTDFLECEQIEL